MRKHFSPEELQGLAAKYDAMPVTEVRPGIGALCDQVSYLQKRVVLTKHEKPVAVLVPVADLAALHTADLAHFAYMAAEADRNHADENETLSLEDASAEPDEPFRPVPATRVPFVHRGEPINETLYGIISDVCRPVVIANLETTIAEGVLSKLSEGLEEDAFQDLRNRIRAGVHQVLEQTRVSDLAAQLVPDKAK